MSLFKEIHRRSLWQILGIYLAASWIVLQVIQLTAESLTLPDWIMPLGYVLLLLGLPVVLATGFVQKGGPIRFGDAAPFADPVRSAEPAAEPKQRASGTDEAGVHHRMFTWKNATVGGVLAFALLGVMAAGWMVTRTLGIGPAATLVAQGVLDERDAIILADFESLTGDTELAKVATLAIRTDLAQSPVVTLLEPGQVSQVLARMERNPDEPLSPDLATEVAIREGIKAVVAGDISAAGDAYVVSARLTSAGSGEELAAVRETAAGSDAIVPAIDRVSKKLRERMGESLRSLGSSPALEDVTTGSLEALRLYGQALEAIEIEGDSERGYVLLEQAIALDSTFAMAYRKLGTELGNPGRGGSRARIIDAISKAYQYRDRLSFRERYLTEAAYYNRVEYDPSRQIAAYETLLDRNPNDSWALNNLGALLAGQRQFERAAELFERAVALDSSSAFQFTNLINMRVALGDYDRGDQLLAIVNELFPDNPQVETYRGELAAARQDHAEAERVFGELSEKYASLSAVRRAMRQFEGSAAATQGRIGDAHVTFDELQREARDEEVSGFYWATVGWAASHEIDVLDDPGAAIARIDRALEAWPIEELDPRERPYIGLANNLAAAGAIDRARRMLEAAESETERRYWSIFQESQYHNALGTIALAEGDYEAAIDAFRTADRDECEPCAGALLGPAFDAAGMPDSSIAQYKRFADGHTMMRFIVDQWWLGLSLERLGQLYDEKGDLDKAAEYHARFVELWADADEGLQPRVRAAQARLQEIVEARG